MNNKEVYKGSAILGMSIASSNVIPHSGLINTSSRRQVHKILNSQGVNVGTLPVLRAFAGGHVDYVTPFVLLDEFGPVQVNPGDDPLRVDAHPHAGVTPTTYFLNGSGHHKDSLNYDFQIGKGDFMIFSSGSGAIHMEESGLQLYNDGGIYHGFQIWLNTPSKFKWEKPTTSVHREANRDTIYAPNYSIKVILGALGEAKSDVPLLSPAFYYHVSMKEGASMEIPTDPTHNAFIYNINGSMEIEGQNALTKNQVVLYERGQSNIGVYATTDTEFLVLGGEPLNEHVYAYGPFVMNTEEEIRKCIYNYNAGLMGNPELVNAR